MYWIDLAGHFLAHFIMLIMSIGMTYLPIYRWYTKSLRKPAIYSAFDAFAIIFIWFSTLVSAMYLGKLYW